LPHFHAKPAHFAKPTQVAGKRALLAVLSVLLLAPLTIAVAGTTTAPKDQAILSKVSDYLNSLKTITAKFMQVGPDGSVRTGQAIVQRPGKLRFQYDKPNPQLLVAGFGLLVYHDPQINQTTNIPLSSTPLGILLDKTVRLSGAVTVTNVSEPPGEIQVSLIRTGKAQQGHITLVFSTDPMELRQWRLTDTQGRLTQVSLYDLHAANPFPDKDFEYIQGINPN
jgi:outer membrane lipoprotein-sorting protein